MLYGKMRQFLYWTKYKASQHRRWPSAVEEQKLQSDIRHIKTLNTQCCLSALFPPGTGTGQPKSLSLPRDPQATHSPHTASGTLSATTEPAPCGATSPFSPVLLSLPPVAHQPWAPAPLSPCTITQVALLQASCSWFITAGTWGTGTRGLGMCALPPHMK